MGATMNVIFVKSDLSTLKNNFSSLLNYFLNNSIGFSSLHISNDEEGFNGIDYNNPNQTFLENIMDKSPDFYYLKLSFNNFPFGNLFIDGLLKIEKHENSYYSFGFEFEEVDILSNYDVDSLESVEKNIINTIEKIGENINWDYAFANQEAEVQFSPEQFEKETNAQYAIEITNSESGLKISKSTWYVNGITERA